MNTIKRIRFAKSIHPVRSASSGTLRFACFSHKTLSIMNRHTPHHRPGIILLVVISSLAFFSILIATYLVYSRDARQSSYNLAARNYRAPEVKDLFDETLMMLVRGTDDPSDPFYGEDLLSDYYGRRNANNLRVERWNAGGGGSIRHIGGGFVRIRVQWVPTAPRPIDLLADDLFTGRLVTFTGGPLQNQTFRVLRSRVAGAAPNWIDVLYIQLTPDQIPAGTNLNHSNQDLVVDALWPLFYPENTDRNTLPAPDGHTLYMNGVPRNSPGLGSDAAGNVNQTIGSVSGISSHRIDSLPVSLQPNQIRGLDTADKSTLQGDFDEDYDAADFFNWFLSYENADGTVVPSFHRPAVINYILNQVDWSSASTAEFRQGLASLARATFRPLPVAEGQYGPGAAVNSQFTGSSSKYALRTPLFPGTLFGANPTDPPNPAVIARLDQFAKALIADPSDRRNQWDVDNTGDGIKDSIWIDLQLPTFTSPEGKLLKPLIAPRIEDLSARLNVNAHGNVTSNSNTAALSTALANWAGTRADFGTNTGTPNNVRAVFRGLGYGPAEIGLPAVSASGTVDPAHVAALHSIITDRDSSQYGARVPGRPGPDPLDVLRTGWRPPLMTAGGGYGYSVDPFGRGGVAMGRSGHLVAAVSGREIAAGSNAPLDTVNEAVNDPYETDPSGETGGELLYSFAELEPLLRASDFDIDLLPQRLRGKLVGLLEDHPEFAAVFTTQSKSEDIAFSANAQGLPGYVNLVQRIRNLGGTALNANQMNQMIGPELRLGRKIDVNRPLGNGIDDTPTSVAGAGVVDEPREVLPGVILPRVAGTPLQAVASATPPGSLPNAFVVSPGPHEGETFAVSSGSNQTVPTAYQGIRPRYNIVQEADENLFQPANANAVYPFDIERDLNNNSLGRQIAARQLLARHLYVMMMLLTRDYDFPAMADTFDPQRTTAGTHDPAFFKARRIAQWAVNVVDYRDSDSIMTRFVFDPNPFDGWSPPAEPAPEQNVVWGVEAPELVFSESLALHDVRVRDTNRDSGSGKAMDDPIDPDPNTDQIRKPEGSLFLELYCPRPQVMGDLEQATKPGVHRELYNVDLATGVAELDLERLAPPRPGATLGAPVWRIAISERHDADAGGKETMSPQLLRQQIPDSYSFDAQQIDELQPAQPVADRLQFDRYVWFNHFDTPAQIQDVITGNGIVGSGTTQMQPHEVFFVPKDDLRENKPINPMRQLAPGQYLTLAPREIIHLGSRLDGGNYPGFPSAHRLAVMTNPISEQGLIQFDHASDLADPAVGRLTPLLHPTNSFYTSALPLIVGAFRPTGWGPEVFEDGFIGLNVSEPLADAYYPEPQFRLKGTTAPDGDPFPLSDSYIDYTDALDSARDTPVDVDPTFAFNRIPFYNANAGSEEPRLGTVPDYCTAFLQRLADPTVPYDPVFNPYRTIDSMTIDLTVFSGEESATKADPNGADARYAARSRQRNGHIGTTQANALFSYETNDPVDELTPLTSVATEDFFALASPGNYLYSSFSFLNTVTPPGTQGDPPTPAGRSNPTFIGFAASIGAEGTAAAAVIGTDRNLPRIPFAVHPWLNRPFASHFELMMVPACSQGRLFEEFSVNLTGGDVLVYPSDPADVATFYAPFRHLLNFFHSGRTGTEAANFARLFDFVHTLPRFQREIEMIHPNRLNLAGTTFTGASNDPFFRALLRPPFNMDYDNQRLGRINLNTVSQFPVWAGLMQGHLNANEFTNVDGAANENQLAFNQFLQSRRGYTPSPLRSVSQGGDINYDADNLSHRFPTQFVGTYRNAMSSLLTPALQDAGASNLLRRREANATLLRVNGLVGEIDPPGASAMISQFIRSQNQIPNNATTLPHLDRNRSAFLRYQTLMRMPNLVSDNSQLYLIRLTMGFFEVDANTGSLGREYNEDLGQNKRYKAMYIIDRSKEVGFIPGQDLNARDVVLYESYSQ